MALSSDSSYGHCGVSPDARSNSTSESPGSASEPATDADESDEENDLIWESDSDWKSESEGNSKSSGGQSPVSGPGEYSDSSECQSSVSNMDSSDLDSGTSKTGDSSDSNDGETSNAAGVGQTRREPIWMREASQEWVGHLKNLSDLRGRKRFRLLLPCAGFDAPGQALRCMGVQCEMVGAWETAKTPAAVLRKMYSETPSQYLHLGRDHGDVMNVGLADLPDADGVVSGPPCPPWSSMGDLSSWKHKNAKVLLRIAQWIAHLSKRGLKFFVLENVLGILRAPVNGGQSPARKLRKFFRKELHGCWKVELVRTNSLSTGHHRTRIYVVGCRIASVGANPTTISSGICDLPRAGLSQIVDKRLPNTDVSSIAKSHKKKLKLWMRKLRPHLRDRKKRGTYACFNVDRNPTKTHNIYRTDDAAPCLRAGAGKPWLLSLGKRRPTTSRQLHPAEACLLQGMSPTIIPEGMSEAAVFRGSGNAMTVPVVGSILHALLGRAKPLLSRKRKRFEKG